MKEKCKKKKKKKTRKEQTGDPSYTERVRAKWFYGAFKLGFLQLICKASLIIMSDLELALSIILKERQSLKSRHVAVEWRCFKIWDLLSILICFSILVKIVTIFTNVARNIVNLYTRKDLKSSGIGSLYEK